MGKTMTEKLCLTSEMLRKLATLKGKTLKSYEANLGGANRDVAVEVVVINTGTMRVPVIREEEPCRLFGEDGECAPFRCYEWGLNEWHPYYGIDSAKQYLVGERINSIEVVRDTARWNKDDVKYELVEDIGITIRTSGHILGLFCDSFESIRVQFDDLSDAESVAMDVDDYWNCKKGDLTVDREIIKL